MEMIEVEQREAYQREWVSRWYIPGQYRLIQVSEGPGTYHIYMQREGEGPMGRQRIPFDIHINLDPVVADLVASNFVSSIFDRLKRLPNVPDEFAVEGAMRAAARDNSRGMATVN